MINSESHFGPADATKEEQVAKPVANTQTRYGRIDVVLNIAGIEGKHARVEEFVSDDYRAVFDANVLGTQLVMKYTPGIMREQKSGCVINCPSVAGLVGIPDCSIYIASKRVVNGLTRLAALEMAADGVWVNAITSGPVDTNMLDRFVDNNQHARAHFINSLPTRRIITSEEIARTVLFLASDAARSIIGQVIAVDGGYSAG